MILGIGTDIIEIKRIEKSIGNPHFLTICYAENEKGKIKKSQSAAGHFAAKEAVAKALGTGFSGFLPCHIEIATDLHGKPYVILHEKAKRIAAEKNIGNIHISITHCNEYAAAFAVAESI